MRSIPLFTALLALAMIVPAAAQMAPNDTGRGIERGLAAMNSSAQVGTLNVSHGTDNPVIVLSVHGQPHGSAQAATINRGSDCDAAAHAAGVLLGQVVNGHLHATSPLPFDRLMSGNYSIIVHNNTATSRAVLCGQLYLN
jgi:hypothetical protein